MADVRIKYKVDKGELVIARSELEKINRELGVSEKQTNKLSGALKGVGGVLVAAFTVDKLIDFGRQVISITAEFQKLKAVLINTLGSRSAAEQAFQNIQKFAANTPFQVNQITDSFVKLSNQGFVPTTVELRKLGDLAASTGKDFDQLTEAIIDAQVGEFERLKEFGIRASKEGDRVTFTFKGVKTQTDFTAESIQNYILSLGDLQGVSGSMAAISETLGGKISNLQDGIDALFFEIGTKLNPVIGGAIDVMGSLIATITKFIGTPFVQQLRLQQTELNVLVGAITDVNTSEQARSHLLTELNSKYPDFLKNLDSEKVTNEQLVDRMSAVNDQFLRKIALTAAEDRLAEQQEELLDNIEREAFLRKALVTQREREEQIRSGNARRQRGDAGLVAKLEEQLNEVISAREGIQKGLQDQLKTYTGALDLFNTTNNDYFATTEKGNQATKKAVELTKEQIKAIKKLEEERLKSLENQQELFDRSFEARAELAILQQEDEVKKELARRNLILNSQQLTEDERLLIIAESEEKIKQIRAEQLKDFETAEQKKRQIAMETANARLQIESEVVNGIMQLSGLLKREAKDAALFFLLIEKAAGIADLIIKLQQELAAIAVNAAANPANAVTFGAAGVAQFATLAAAAKIRTGIGIGLIAAQGISEAAGFAEGVINLKGGVKGKDSVPSLLMPGESVMTTAETRDFMPTLKAIRENRIDPEVLNAVANGKAGGVQVHNSVVEVPRDTVIWNEDGFSYYMNRKNAIVQRKGVRYKC